MACGRWNRSTFELQEGLGGHHRPPNKLCRWHLLHFTVCRFALYNIKKNLPLWKLCPAPCAALVISCLNYCNVLLTGLPSRTITPLQVIKNAAPHLISEERSMLEHCRYLYIAATWDKGALTLIYSTEHSYQSTLIQVYSPSWPLCSTRKWHLVPKPHRKNTPSKDFQFSDSMMVQTFPLVRLLCLTIQIFLYMALCSECLHPDFDMLLGRFE